MSFRNRLLITFAVVLIINTALLLAVTFHLTRSAFRTQSRLTIASALASAEDHLRSTIDRLEDELTLLVESDSFGGLLDDAAAGHTRADRYAVVSAADESRIRSERLDFLRAIGPGGVILSSSPDSESYGGVDREWTALASMGERGPHLCTIDVDESPTRFVALLARRSSGVVVVAGIALDAELAAELSRRAGAPVAIGTASGWVTEKGPSVSAIALASPDTVRADGFIVVHGRERSAAMTRLFDGHVTLVVLQEEKALAGLQAKLTRLAIVVGIVSLLLSGALAFVIARGVSRPVRELARATDRVASGDWNEHVRVASGPAEFRTLATAFNSMLDELRREREALVRTERVAAWRDAARRVAHEIRNTLTPLQLAWERLSASARKDSATAGSALHEGAESVSRELTTLRRIVGEFSELAKWPEPVLADVDIAEQVRTTTELYAGDSRGRVAVSARGSFNIRADAGQISRAVANLIENALEATAQDGLVQVSVTEENGTVIVEVADDGRGMDEATLEQVFTPYFTTRDTGTGLGLSIVDRVVDAHHGTIKVRSARDVGTTVRLSFPKDTR